MSDQDPQEPPRGRRARGPSILVPPTPVTSRGVVIHRSTPIWCRGSAGRRPRKVSGDSASTRRHQAARGASPQTHRAGGPRLRRPAPGYGPAGLRGSPHPATGQQGRLASRRPAAAGPARQQMQRPVTGVAVCGQRDPGLRTPRGTGRGDWVRPSGFPRCGARFPAFCGPGFGGRLRLVRRPG